MATMMPPAWDMQMRAPRSRRADTGPRWAERLVGAGDPTMALGGQYVRERREHGDEPSLGEAIGWGRPSRGYLESIRRQGLEQANIDADKDARSREEVSPGSTAGAPGRPPAKPTAESQTAPVAPTTAGGHARGLASQAEPAPRGRGPFGGAAIDEPLRRGPSLGQLGASPMEAEGITARGTRPHLRYSERGGPMMDYTPGDPSMPDIGRPGRGGAVFGGGFEHMSPAQRAAFPSYGLAQAARQTEAQTALAEREAQDPGFLGHRAGLEREGRQEERAYQQELQEQLRQEAFQMIEQFERQRDQLMEEQRHPQTTEERKKEINEEIAGLEWGLDQRLRGYGFSAPER